MKPSVCCLMPFGPSADILRVSSKIRSEIFSKHFILEICGTEKIPFGPNIFVCPCEMVQKLLDGPKGISSSIIAFGPAKNLSLAIAAGAIDYMRDNWDLEELYFRCMKIIGSAAKDLSWATVYADGRTSSINGVPLVLTRGQHLFFEILVANAGKVLLQEAILSALYIHNSRSRVLSVYASELRRQIAGFVGVGAEKILVGCYGQGYLLQA